MRRRQLYAYSNVQMPDTPNNNLVVGQVSQLISNNGRLLDLPIKGTCPVCGVKIGRGMAGHMRSHK